jgi:hypothetical protein
MGRIAAAVDAFVWVMAKRVRVVADPQSVAGPLIRQRPRKAV